MDITELLAFAVKNKASDLHLSSGLPPMIRVHGDIRRINLPPMEHDDVHAMVYDIMSDQQRKMYEETLECDFSFAVPNLARVRVNAFNQQRGASAAFRTIPSKVLSLEELNAPKAFAELTQRRAQRVGKRQRMRTELALVDEALLRLVQELDRVLDRQHVAALVLVDVIDDGRQRRRFARPGRPRHQHEAAAQLSQLL